MPQTAQGPEKPMSQNGVPGTPGRGLGRVPGPLSGHVMGGFDQSPAGILSQDMGPGDPGSMDLGSRGCPVLGQVLIKKGSQTSGRHCDFGLFGCPRTCPKRGPGTPPGDPGTMGPGVPGPLGGVLGPLPGPLLGPLLGHGFLRALNRSGAKVSKPPSSLT